MWATLSSSRFSARAGWLSKLSSLVLLFLLPVASQAANCALRSDGCDEGTAYKECVAALDRTIAHAVSFGYPGEVAYNCTRTVTAPKEGQFLCGVKYGSVWKCNAPDNIMQNDYLYAGHCLDRAEVVNQWATNVNKVCHNGCVYHGYRDPSTGSTFFSTFKEGVAPQLCTPGPDNPDPELCPAGGCPPDDGSDDCPEGQSDPDGDGVCTPTDDDGGDDEGGDCEGNKEDPDGDGTCSCPSGQTDPDGDNTCTVPGDDDGEGECAEGEDCSGNGTSSGGDDCSAGPVSTGGDPLLHAVIRHSWLVRCGKTKSDADGDGRPDWTKLKPEDQPNDDDGEDDETSVSNIRVGVDLLDTSGIIGGGSCPTLGTIDIHGWASVSFDSESWWCDLIRIMRAAVLLMAAFTAVRILMGGQ